MFDTIEEYEEELATLRNETPQWAACIEAMTHHPDWDPEDPDGSLAIINQLLEGWRI